MESFPSFDLLDWMASVLTPFSFADEKLCYLKVAGRSVSVLREAFDDELGGLASSLEIEIPAKVEDEGKKYSVTEVNFSSFQTKSIIEKIKLPSTIKKIPIDSFDDYSALTDIEIDPENPAYSSEDGLLFNKDRTQLIRCPRGKRGNLAIPDSVIVIGEFAFSGCAGLEKK